LPENLPNGHKKDKMAQNRQNDRKIDQHLPLHEPPKFTQIGIFGLKLCHLATLPRNIFFQF
jgi:hypothetical protein